jgi:hypothetical protein
MRRACLSLALTATAVLAASAYASPLPTLLVGSFGHTFEVRPSAVVYTGDGSSFLGVSPGTGKGHWHWRVWNHDHAYGVGTIWLDTCRPDCADGKYLTPMGSARASRARHNHYTRLKARYRRGARRVTQVWRLSHGGAGFYWNLP